MVNFNVLETETKQIYIVYDIANHNADTRFLIYKDGNWVWLPCERFIPAKTI